jgi:hypothetical protein
LGQKYVNYGQKSFIILGPGMLDHVKHFMDLVKQFTALYKRGSMVAIQANITAILGLLG